MSTSITIDDGDFEKTGSGNWIYSKTGNPIGKEEEEIKVNNQYARFYHTESISQAVNGIREGYSGSVTFKLRGVLGVTVSLYEPGTENTVWSSPVAANPGTDWQESTVSFTKLENVPDRLSLRFQAVYSTNAEDYVDIDDVSATIDG